MSVVAGEGLLWGRRRCGVSLTLIGFLAGQLQIFFNVPVTTLSVSPYRITGLRTLRLSLQWFVDCKAVPSNTSIDSLHLRATSPALPLHTIHRCCGSCLLLDCPFLCPLSYVPTPPLVSLENILAIQTPYRHIISFSRPPLRVLQKNKSLCSDLIIRRIPLSLHFLMFQTCRPERRSLPKA
ncbi:hypothetical protein BXZ70DRAFT_960579 [Cristinia sonorae]|uniref:Uncharacterized protein n=1 Tax=Cristinia sonorae TaxID=1940300 RepID=A0A8K0UEY3_9AGAR|nr:hypothetical protein BXZ70DRAFT_960579 [Cristinia sonorae]